MSKLISIITPIIHRNFFPPAELTPDRNLGFAPISKCEDLSSLPNLDKNHA